MRWDYLKGYQISMQCLFLHITRVQEEELQRGITGEFRVQIVSDIKNVIKVISNLPIILYSVLMSPIAKITSLMERILT